MRLSVLDVSGRLVGTLVDGTMSAGAYPVAWNARARDGAALPPGVSLVRFEHGGLADFRRLVVAVDRVLAMEHIPRDPRHASKTDLDALLALVQQRG